jgi:hypothetical protein
MTSQVIETARQAADTPDMRLTKEYRMTALETRIEQVEEPETTLLGKAMIDNAIVSGLTGLGLAASATAIDDWLGLNAWVIAVVGLGLIGFAVDLVVWARSPRWLIKGGRLAVAGDSVWVVGSLALIGFSDVLSPSGEAALAGVSLVVAGFAIAQSVGLQRLTSPGA